LQEGIPIAAAEKESISWLKHDSGIRCTPFAFCPATARISASDLDALVFYK